MTDSRGFSLLEMLVVLLIVGLFSALSVAWLEGGPGAYQRALEELASEARVHAAQARHGGQLTGLRWSGRQPEFVRLQVENGQTFWRLEASRLTPWPAHLQADWPVSSVPQVIFTPSGVAQPTALNWRWPEGRQRWQWRTDNALEIAARP